MTYEQWIIEFEHIVGVPYHYLKELGDHWFWLATDGELLRAIKSPFKDMIDIKAQDKLCEEYLIEVEKRFSSSDEQMKKRFTI